MSKLLGKSDTTLVRLNCLSTMNGSGSKPWMLAVDADRFLVEGQPISKPNIDIGTKAQGGLEVMAERNKKKAALVYAAIDSSNGFYAGHADQDSRSFMNVTFRLPNEELEKKFVAEALEQQLGGVKGHRSVGGMRASIYNAMPYEGCEKLADFMEKFRKANA